MDLLVSFAMVLAAMCLGAMLFFSLGVAPLLFRVLDMAAGGLFVRALFPVYYAAGGALAAVAGLLVPGRWSGWALLLIALVFVYLRQVLMPAINAASDRAKAGDGVAGARFARLHRWSVGLNGVQLVVLLVALVDLMLA